MDESRVGQTDHVAEKMYRPADYESESHLAKGLAMTHEQVSDAYMMGTLDERLDLHASRQNPGVDHAGYEEML